VQNTGYLGKKQAKTNLLSEEWYTKRQVSFSLAVIETAVHQSIVTFWQNGVYTGCKRSGMEVTWKPAAGM